VGLWVSTQQSIVRTGADGQEALLAAVDRLGEGPPSELSGTKINAVTDYRIGDEDRPSWLGAQDLIELALGEEGRILVRPSGTEPKLKIYVDLSGSTRPDHATAHGRLLARAQELAAAMGKWLEV
jgi:phosphomannomutase